MFSWLSAFSQKVLSKNQGAETVVAHWKYFLVLAFILFLGAFTRLWQLGALPTGLTWDEAALGYIGKMVITTGMDEHMDRLPIVFESFGDFKAPLAMYSTGIFTTLLGMHVWVVRLPFALAGIASIAVIMWITWRLTQHKWYPVLAGWLLVISPWHILFSRVGFESGLALLAFLVLLASWMEIRDKTLPNWRKHLGWGLLVLSIVGGLYVYHSTKVVFPLIVGSIAVYEYFTQRKYWLSQWRIITVAVIFASILLTPFLYTVLNGTGIARATQTTVFAQNMLPTALVLFFKNLAQYFSVGFLALGDTDSLRHSTGSRGVFLWSQLILFLLGLTFGVARPLERWVKPKKRAWQKHLAKYFAESTQSSLLSTPVWLWILFAIIGFLPAAIGVETPHPNRALLALPAFIIIMVSGARELEKELPEKIFTTLISGIIMATIIEWAAFWSFYRTEYRLTSAESWMEGYEEAVLITHSYIADNKRTKFTTAYGEPQIFFAFYNQVPFETYQLYRFPGNVQFGKTSSLDANQFDVVITAASEPLENYTPTKTIVRSDDSAAFYIYEIQ